MNERIEIWHKSCKQTFDKEKLAALLIPKIDTSNAYTFILQNLDRVETIQIYQDNVIRLHFKHRHYETKASAFLSNIPRELIMLLIGLA